MDAFPENTRYDFDGSHATPMLLSGENADPILVARQDELAHKLEALAHTELDDRIGFELAEFVGASIRRRMSQREGQNSHSYISRRHKYIPTLLIPGHSPIDVYKATRMAAIGAGSPLQMHLARRAHGMGSSEDANLTTIGNARQHLREPMHDAVQELAGHDIDFGMGSLYRMSFLGTDVLHGGDTTEKPSLMRIGYKSSFSTLEDGAVLKGRMTSIIDVRDHTVFDRDMIRTFHELDRRGESLSNNPDFTQVVSHLVSNVIDASYILASNETIYEVHEPTLARARAVLDRKTRRSRSKLDTPTGYSVGDYRRYPKGDPRRVALEQHGTE